MMRTIILGIVIAIAGIACNDSTSTPEDLEFDGSMTYDTYQNTVEGTGHLRLEGSGFAMVTGIGSVLLKNMSPDTDYSSEDADVITLEDGSILFLAPDEATAWMDGTGTMDAQGVGVAKWTHDPGTEWNIDYVDE